MAGKCGEDCISLLFKGKVTDSLLLLVTKCSKEVLTILAKTG